VHNTTYDQTYMVHFYLNIQVRSSVEKKLGKFDMYKAIEFDETQGMITKYNVRVSIHFFILHVI